MPNTLDDISETLEREFILRSFNKGFLGMELSEGSDLHQLIGVGNRIDQKTGQIDKVVNFYPSYFKNVVRTFETCPVYKHFGLTVDQAMRLPFDQWLFIKAASEKLAEQKPHDLEYQLLEVIKRLSGLTRGGEE